MALSSEEEIIICDEKSLSSPPAPAAVVPQQQQSSSPPSLPSNAAPPKSYSDPFLWSFTRKWIITVLLALMTFISTFASSIWSSTITVTAVYFHTSQTIALLGVSLFVLGYGVGPLLWGPMSELMGRRIPMFMGYALFVVMQVPIALGRDLVGVLVCRFLAGVFGSAPLVLASAACADFWDPSWRGIAMASFSVAAYAGPSLGPVVGSFVVASSLGWRWTAWIVLVLGVAVGVPAFLLVPETYGPVLEQRATGKFMVQSEGAGGGFVRKYLSRPMMMLLKEPLLDIMTLYISLTYGIMYLTFFAFPYAFSERGWSRQIASLPFLSLMGGVIMASIFVTVFSTRYYQPRLVARQGRVCPEDRLPMIMLGSVLLPTGLFAFAWTSDPKISAVPQVIFGFFIGAGIMLVFTGGLAYIMDIYLQKSASAIAANTFVRSFAAAGLPLAAPTMYENLGTSWATSMLGFLCVALIPAPFLFYRYGESMRKKSQFAVVM